MDQTQELRKVKVADLEPWDRNPRIISDQNLTRLSRSLERFGNIQPIIVNIRTGRVVGGHQRLRVLQDQGVEETFVVDVDLPESEEAALNIALNNPNLQGEFETASLTDILLEMREDGATDELELTGFDGKEIDELLRDVIGDRPGLKDPEAEIEPPAETIIKLGDVIRFGNHVLVCADSTDATIVEFLTGPEPWSLMITDPPYGVSYADKNEWLNVTERGNRIQTPIEGDHMTIQDTETLWREMFEVWMPHSITGGSYYVTCPQMVELFSMAIRALTAAGYPPRHVLIWAKNNHVLGRTDYHYKHEPILFGWNPNGGHRWFGGRSQTSLWEIDRSLVSALHPTMKPVALYEKAIRNSSAANDIVVDPFVGSGTIFIAAEKTERRGIGTEISPTYCDVAITRWVKFTGIQDIQINGEGVKWPEPS